MVSVIQIAQRSSGILTTSNSGCGSWWEPLTTQIMQRSSTTSPPSLLGAKQFIPSSLRRDHSVFNIPGSLVLICDLKDFCYYHD